MSSSGWYQPGMARCTYEDCTFSGSQKAVEIHRMDRHLIYPPGWDARKRSSDWDADPSLKGKIIPIQGTNITLDKEEVLEAWIAERKRRWPTAARVEEKRKGREEAVARGQIVDGPSQKRPRLDEPACTPRDGNYQRGRGGGRGRGRGAHSGWKLPQKPVSENEESSDADEDESPEVVSSKKPPQEIVSQPPKVNKPPKAPKQPRKPPHNPFASHPVLLRNLLLPEIRVTVSNLSQAIRFLVDNDFLRDVELNAGDADKIIVL